VKTKAARGSKADKDKDKDTAKDDGSVQLYRKHRFHVLILLNPIYLSLFCPSTYHCGLNRILWALWTARKPMTGLWEKAECQEICTQVC